MVEHGRLPQFVVIGAAKAATTWIQAQLQANPAVYMPDPEPHFFSREFELGEAHYREWFEPAPPQATLIGEKSADYLSDPQVPSRLSAMVPDAKLVVQLRDPVERAYSDYKMYFRRNLVSDTPKDYLLAPSNKYPRFLCDGLYGRHIRAWLDHFPRDQILAFRFEDVKERPRTVVDMVSKHIGVETVFDAELADKPENDSRAHLLPHTVRSLLAPLKDTVRPLRGRSWFESVRSLMAREVSYPSLSADLRERMYDFYRDDILLAEQLLGLDLSSWNHRREVVLAS